MASDQKTEEMQLTEAAALWYAQLDSGEANVAEFEAWRAADLRHAVAFARILGTVALLDRAKHAERASREQPTKGTPTDD